MDELGDFRTILLCNVEFTFEGFFLWLEMEFSVTAAQNLNVPSLYNCK